MLEYIDYAEIVDEKLQHEKLRVWRQLTLTNGRPVSIYASGERGKFGTVSFHLFLTYVKTAKAHEFESFSADCLNYALKASELPLAKQLISTCLILPCLATHTTFRELVLAAEKTATLRRGEQADSAKGPKNAFLQTIIVPCLLNLTTHRSFHSGARSGQNDGVFKLAEELLLETVVPANEKKDLDLKNR